MRTKKLTRKQIKRLYEVYAFEDTEEILSAWIDRKGQLYIEYEDADGIITTYEPCVYDNEDELKIKYILTGEGEY